MQGRESDGWSITLYGTKVTLNKGFIGDVGDKVDMIVLGRSQQATLRNPFFCDTMNWCRHEWCSKGCSTVYRKSRDDESASDDDTYNSFKYVDNDVPEKQQIWTRALETKVNCGTVIIREPRIMVDDSEFYYINEYEVECRGRQAIVDALELCYNDILSEVLEELDDKKGKSIALPALSTDVGFPRGCATLVAVKTIVEFIRNNSGAYSLIELFVEKRSEYALYKELLEACAIKK